MEPIKLLTIDYTILIAYVAFVIGIGWALSRYMKTSADFLTSARSIPTWVTGLAFISANLGALELVGMAASGAKYGISTAHFYWLGAIPAMILFFAFELANQHHLTWLAQYLQQPFCLQGFVKKQYGHWFLDECLQIHLPSPIHLLQSLYLLPE